MASQAQIQSLVEEKRKSGMADNDIFLDLAKRDDDIGSSINKASQDIGSHKVGDYFGLKLEAEDPNSANKREVSMPRSIAESAAAGLANAGGGILQGVAWLGDKANEGINKAFGTNLETHALDAVTKDQNRMNADIEAGRRGAGREGTDIVKVGTEIGATIPAFLVGGGAGTGVKAAGAFATRQAALGATVGAAKTAENSDERLANMGGNAIGAALGGVAGEKVISPAIQSLARQIARTVANKTGRTAEAATGMVDDAINKSEFDIPATQQQAMYDQATKALKSGKEMDADAMVNQALLEKHGIKGTQAQINRDATTWRDEKELAKLNPALMNTHVDNHQQFTDLMRNVIDDTGAMQGSNRDRMQSAFDTLRQNNDVAKQNIGQLYDDARNMTGNDASLNHMRFINNATNELEQNQIGSFVPSSVKSVFSDMFKDPNAPFTYGKSEELTKILNAEMRKAERAGDGNASRALGIIRSNLSKEVDDTANELSNALPNGDSLGATKQQFDTARQAYKEHAQALENTPMLAGAVDGIAPDKAFGKYVLNANVDDLKNAVTQFGKHPEGQQNIADMQGAVIEHFLNSATKSNNGTVSPHALNKAMQDFGDERMSALFSPEQINHIKEVKNVSDLLFQQPIGAAVNHSNTASNLQYLMGLTGMLGNVPVIGQGVNLARGVVGLGGDALKRGKAAEMLNGTPNAIKGSELGLTEQEKQLIMLARQMSGGAGSPLGAAYGDDEAKN